MSQNNLATNLAFDLIGVPGTPKFFANEVSLSSFDPGDSVTSWKNLSSGVGDGDGTGHAADVAVVGGRKVLSFDGASGEYYTLPDFSTWTEGTMAIVFRQALKPPIDPLLSGSWNLGSYSGFCYAPFTDEYLYDAFGTSTRQTACINMSGLDYDGLTLLVARSSAGTWDARINGSDSFSFSTTGHTVGFGSAPTIGWPGSGGRYFNGDIAEVVVYDSFLSSEMRSALEASLLGKWNIS